MSYPRKLVIKSIFVLFSIGIAFLVIIGVSSYFSLSDPSKYGMIVTLLIGFYMYPLITKLADWFDMKVGPVVEQKVKDIHNGRRGYEGENTVFDWLKEIVGKENILRNISLPGHKFDIDLVVVGLKGIIVVEVKNFTDPVRFESDDYFQEKGDQKILLSPDDDPRWKVSKYAFALRGLFNSNGFKDIRITKVIAFANGQVSWDGKTGMYIAKDKEYLRQYIDSLEDDPDCTPEVCEKIMYLLTKK